MKDPTKSTGVLMEAEPRRVDLQDALLIFGFLSVVGGVAAIHWPSALILAGVMFFVSALLIERTKRADRKDAN